MFTLVNCCSLLYTNFRTKNGVEGVGVYGRLRKGMETIRKRT
jgi:hypothetical protein